MNNVIIPLLHTLLKEQSALHGKALLSDVTLLRNLLADYAPQHRAERNLLLHAAEENIPAEIAAQAKQREALDPLLIGRWVKRLETDHGIASENARWAVKTWIKALDHWDVNKLVSSANLSTEAEEAQKSLDQGWKLWQLKQYDEALANFTQAIRLAPEFARAYYMRGNMLHRLGRYDEALADYTQAIRLAPKSTWAHIKRGIICREREWYKMALANFKRAIALDPDNTRAFCERANTHAALKKWHEAISDYTTAINLDPRHAQAFRGRGDAYSQLHEWDKSLSDYQRAIKIDPSLSSEIASSMRNVKDMIESNKGEDNLPF